MRRRSRILILVACGLVAAPAALADDTGSWWPDGMVCDATGDCRYVAPGCELVRVMDDVGPWLSGTRRVLFCRVPRGVA